MAKGIKILILLLLISSENTFSQQLSHQVLVPVAGVSTAGGFSYSQTSGETMVEIIGNPDFVLTQGFQQPGMKVSSVIKPDGNGVDVYPNPVTDFVNIKFFGDAARNFKVDVITITGTIVNTGTINFTDSYYYIQQIAFDKFRTGLYFIRIVSDDGLISRTFKIEKI